MRSKIKSMLLFLFTLGIISIGIKVIIPSSEALLTKRIRKINVATIAFNELVPFDWDTVYTFDPYVPKEEMEKIMNIKSKKIRETVNEGMTQLFFVKDEIVVCSIIGYPENLGYLLVFPENNSEQGIYSKIEFEDNIIFSVERIKEFVQLIPIN